MQQLDNANFEKIANDQKGLFIIKFSSPTCGPCKIVKPVVDVLDKNNPDITFFEVDTSLSPELAAHFEIRGVPTILYCEQREVIYSLTGVTPLVDMQYIIDNIDNEYFREHGEFEKPAGGTDWTMVIAIALVFVFLISMALFA